VKSSFRGEAAASVVDATSARQESCAMIRAIASAKKIFYTRKEQASVQEKDTKRNNTEKMERRQNGKGG
jgi:hypothetical protein